jgi:prolyl oligopeptidase
MDVPHFSTVSLAAADPFSDTAYVTSEGFLEPPTLWKIDVAHGAFTPLKRLPPKFDASKSLVEQRFAVSSDGARIPYFLVRPKSMKFDGSTPTYMFGYGGFSLSETPHYLQSNGKFWLERGGALVFANIRGGGEFGPAWHEAAIREHRQLAFDDFAAIARDLISKGISSPRRLGIWGASNGGVLVSVTISQHPELFGAAILDNPIIDMLRYTHLGGAQWVQEYGDPDNPADRSYLAKYSAYTAIKSGARHPPTLILTNTLDDRVSPAHARKFAALLEGLGDPVLFFEDTYGGHSGGVDPDKAARVTARSYLFMDEELMEK